MVLSGPLCAARAGFTRHTMAQDQPGEANASVGAYSHNTADRSPARIAGCNSAPGMIVENHASIADSAMSPAVEIRSPVALLYTRRSHHWEWVLARMLR